jgi:hypothetical protein
MPLPRPDARGAGQALVALSAVAAYLRAPLNGFAVDDVVIASHPLLQRASTLPAAAFAPWWYPTEHLYRPLSTLVIGSELLLAHGAAWLPHTINVLLHALVAVLVMRFAARWLPLQAALAAGLLVLGTLGGDVPHTLFRTLPGATRLALALSLLPASAAMMFLPVRPAPRPAARRHCISRLVRDRQLAGSSRVEVVAHRASRGAHSQPGELLAADGAGLRCPRRRAA